MSSLKKKTTATASLVVNNAFGTLFNIAQSITINVGKYEFAFCVYGPDRFRSQYVDHVSAALMYNQNEEIMVEYVISVLDEQGNKWRSIDLQKTFKASFQSPIEPQIEVTKLGTVEEILDASNHLLRTGKLFLICEIEVVDPSVKINNQPLPKLAQDQLDLLRSGRFSDFALMVGDRRIPVHQSILGARSPVFAAMFEHDTKERQDGYVDITDLDQDVCMRMLIYIYSDSVQDLDVFALELLAAADKYSLDDLKAKCAQYLATHLTSDMVSHILLQADMHHCEKLKVACVDYIIERGHEVKDTDGWKVLTAARPELAAELFLRLSDKYQQMKTAQQNVRAQELRYGFDRQAFERELMDRELFDRQLNAFMMNHWLPKQHQLQPHHHHHQ